MNSMRQGNDVNTPVDADGKFRNASGTSPDLAEEAVDVWKIGRSPDMKGAMHKPWQIAVSAPVVERAARIATVAGIVLAAIKHGDSLLQGDINPSTTLKILLSFCVPYSVSTYSSVLAVRE